MPLDRFAVSLDAPEGSIRLSTLDAAVSAPVWRLHRFEPCPDYVGALAVEGDSLLRFYGWPQEEPE